MNHKRPALQRRPFVVTLHLKKEEYNLSIAAREGVLLYFTHYIYEPTRKLFS